MLVFYAAQKKLFKQVCLAEIAEQHRWRTGDEPVIAVDGPGCVSYLYENCDRSCGGQFREFREACRNFVQQFRDCGVRLVFFFHGIRPVEENEIFVQKSKVNVEKLEQMLEKLPVTHRVKLPLPGGLIACARVFFRDEPSAEVRLCLEDYNREIAEYAGSCENCLGVMSLDGNFLLYKEVPRVFVFEEKSQTRIALRMKYVCQSDISSVFGLEANDMPAFAEILENGIICSLDPLMNDGQLFTSFEDIEKLADFVANLVKNKTFEKMCQTTFGNWERKFDEIVKVGMGQYEYKPRGACNGVEMESHWSRVLQSIEAKHKSGEIPVVLLSVARHRTFRDVLEGFAPFWVSQMEEGLCPMRRRIYTVLLWESGNGPFHVEEVVSTSTVIYRWSRRVFVSKQLPPTLAHPGLLKLWTGDLDTRWRLFSWIVGSPDPKGSALRSLEPQCLVVPAAALSFLRRQYWLLSPHEAEIFAVVAITVCRFSPQELAQKHPPALDQRAVFLSTLFVRTALHVLDAAAICGLSFPREADCQLDAYFDGKLFHDLYLKAKAHTPWNSLNIDPIRKLLDVVEGTCTGSRGFTFNKQCTIQ